LQEAVAISFEKQIAKLDQDECYFNCIPNDLKAKRDYMAKILHDVGMEPTVPEGGYVIWVDWSFLGRFLHSKIFIFDSVKFRTSSGSQFGKK
jgi:kynurenine--oxoglutarate transaminase/cysteine-S-conjugate beta-lyase/glutamine--phenylpyruvate transaminase